MPEASSSSPLRALLSWIVLSVVFVVAGGLGAGVVALLYEWVVGKPFGDPLYAVIFGGIGLVAFRIARAYADERSEARRRS